MKSRLVRTVGFVAVIVAVAGVSYTAGAVQAGRAVMTPVGAVKWEPLAPGSPLQAGLLWGDRTKPGEYGILLKIPAGFESGRHSHTADYHAVAVQGNWVHSNDGTPAGARELAPGSFVYQPGKMVHTDVCKSKTDCIVLLHQHGPNDFIPAKTP